MRTCVSAFVIMKADSFSLSRVQDRAVTSCNDCLHLLGTLASLRGNLAHALFELLEIQVLILFSSGCEDEIDIALSKAMCKEAIDFQAHLEKVFAFKFIVLGESFIDSLTLSPIALGSSMSFIVCSSHLPLMPSESCRGINSIEFLVVRMRTCKSALVIVKSNSVGCRCRYDGTLTRRNQILHFAIGLAALCCHKSECILEHDKVHLALALGDYFREGHVDVSLRKSMTDKTTILAKLRPLAAIHVTSSKICENIRNRPPIFLSTVVLWTRSGSHTSMPSSTSTICFMICPADIGEKFSELDFAIMISIASIVKLFDLSSGESGVAFLQKSFQFVEVEETITIFIQFIEFRKHHCFFI
mmetsp:Transcript_28470/g.45191  ORF Transcript_28470/g.45191 Transcript_28470/m.45191 type:complete len:358 (+) Transcript_28470:746-1819(+)